MFKRHLIPAFTVLFLAITATAQQPTPQKLNVLFIIADDLRPDLGSYGVTAIKTPHIDKIAARGTRYGNAYAQWPR